MTLVVRDWLKRFQNRLKDFSLRQSEAISIAKATAGSLREKSGPGTNINSGLSFYKDQANWSCRVLYNYK